MKRTICVVTGTRADYGLLFKLMGRINSDRDLNLQIISTGMHLSPEFGKTYTAIESDGFVIDKRIEILLSSDTQIGISKSMGLALISFGEAFSELDPDIVLLLGDRFETFCAACAACVACIPVAHIHGGENTEGVIDESFRHSITKMSHLHFTSTEEYRHRVIQLGEHPDRVFNVGALGVDNIQYLKLFDRENLEKTIKFSLGDQCILVTFHPVTLEDDTASEQFQTLLNAIQALPKLRTIFTKANADTGGRIINQMIDDFVTRHNDRSLTFTSMGQIRYLSTMKYVNAVVGNSSSAIIEAPSFRVPTVNIGDRQKGRVKAKSVIDCEPTLESILGALKKALSPEFKKNFEGLSNPYEKQNTSKSIRNILKSFELKGILKKEFYNLPMELLKQAGNNFK
jgi:GDP/UDP-N,N'-diacetylbacillosamine 2-epimerase (hydrolysing)